MAKLIVKRKVIVEEIVIPKEYAEDLRFVLRLAEINIINLDKASLEQQEALTFARQLLRKMRGEEA